MLDRYFIDERGGCIAVRDREQTDPDYNGLHSDTAGVMWFEMGIYTPRKCDHCGSVSHYTWELKDGARDRAEAEAARLNKESPNDQP